MRLTLSLCIALLLTSGCDPATTEESPEDVVPRGDRVLSIDIVNANGEDYGAALATAQALGSETVFISLTWERLEPQPGVYDFTFPDIIETFYPSREIGVGMMIGPVDTNNDVRPADLRDLPFDHPDVIARYQTLIDTVLSRVPTTELTTIALGNEVDAWLSDPTMWTAYQALYEAGAAHVRALRPEVTVGVKVTFGGLTGGNASRAAQLNTTSDAILTTYYPLEDDFTMHPPSVVSSDFAELVRRYPDRPIEVLEAGYPASPTCDSSDEQQAEFVTELFKAWDVQKDHISVVSYSFLTDFSPAEVDEFETYYGLSDPAFLAYLGTLGLRRNDGSHRPAYDRFAAEASARGW
ncbi:MAG: hypothetical protein AAF170_01605 [Bacteroidota bacterium]